MVYVLQENQLMDGDEGALSYYRSNDS